MAGPPPEFYYCARCGFLVEGGRDLKCSCIHPQPQWLMVPATSVGEVRTVIACGGRVRVELPGVTHGLPGTAQPRLQKGYCSGRSATGKNSIQGEAILGREISSKIVTNIAQPKFTDTRIGREAP